jgi:hypothetical protein
MDVHWTRLGAVVLPGKHKPFSPQVTTDPESWGLLGLYPPKQKSET